jgi:hypothetical protein
VYFTCQERDFLFNRHSSRPQRIQKKMARQSALRVLPALVFLMTTVLALKHNFHEFAGPSLIGPVGEPFGFLKGGHYELSVFDFALHYGNNLDSNNNNNNATAVEAGFFLQRFDNQAQFDLHMDTLRSDRTLCSFAHFIAEQDDTFHDTAEVDGDYQNVGTRTAKNGILLTMKNTNTSTGISTTVSYTFQQDEDGLYFLIYQICGPHAEAIKSTFELDFHFLNYDYMGNISFLTAGEMRLPLLFFFFSMSYLVCLIVWVMNNRDIAQGGSGIFDDSNASATVYSIHHLMSALLLFKFLATLFESLRYHAIRISGHAEVWTVFYYFFTFVKGTFMFTVILLIGTGWSFVKPFLNDREKKVVAFILCFQVINNIALIVLSHETEGESEYAWWSAVLHLVDILCCCAVLVPIVWQVNALEKSVSEGYEDVIDEEERELALESGDKGRILIKLRLFRSFYLLVVAYIYATRILVYLFSTMLSYKYLWVSYFVVELITLSFYVSVGFMFRPMIETPYASVDRREDEDGTVIEFQRRTN